MGVNLYNYFYDVTRRRYDTDINQILFYTIVTKIKRGCH